MRTWGPPGGRYPITRPGPGRKFLNGSSALMRHSIACPCTPHRLFGFCAAERGSVSATLLQACPIPVRAQRRKSAVRSAQGFQRARLDLDVLLLEAQDIALRGLDLLLNQVHARDHLRHRVLHLRSQLQLSTLH